jgi:SulP family sulfate permease
VIRSRIRSAARSLVPPRETLKEDVLAGIPGAVSSVPDGMASAVLVGVNPIHGLYASALGPLAGGFFSSTRLMVITTTSAAALAAGSTLQDIDPGDRNDPSVADLTPSVPRPLPRGASRRSKL